MRGPAKLAVAVALLCVTLGVFAPVRHHEFVDLDDLGGIEGNAELEVDSLGQALRRALSRPLLANWIPVTALSHQLDRRLHGPTGGGHQLTNVGLHAVAAALLFLALEALTGAGWRSAFVAGVFALHPLHVETAVWVSERKGVLSGVFFALTLWAHARHARRATRGSAIGVYAAFCLALLSKPTAVTIPCVLLLLDFWPLRRLGRRALLEKLPMFGLVVAYSVVTYLVQRDTGAMAFGEEIPLDWRALNAVSAYGTYLAKSVWPADLAVFYPYPKGGPDPLRAAWVALALGTASAAWVWLRHSRPWLLVGWLWFGGMLVPTLGLVQVGEQSHADRYMYLPLIGLALAVAWEVGERARARGARMLATVAALAVLAALALASNRQLVHWRDSWTLWNRVLEVSPGDPRSLMALGSLHGRLMELEHTERYFLAAYRSDPQRARTRDMLRRYFMTKAAGQVRRGEREAALESLRAAVRFDPGEPAAERALGRALAALGEQEEARAHLALAFRSGPEDPRVVVALARGAEAGGRLAEALRLRRELLRSAPGHAANTNDLAWLLATAPDPALRDPQQAVRLAEGLEGAEGLAPANLLDTLAASYAAAGRFAEAVETAERAVDTAARSGDARLAAQAGARLALYRSGRPWVQGGGEPAEPTEPAPSG